MRRLLALCAAAIVVAVVLAACGDDEFSTVPGTPPTTPGSTPDGPGASPGSPTGRVPSRQELLGQRFAARSAEGRELVPGSELTVAFEEAYVAVSAGCNRISGAYTLADGTFSFRGKPATTQMACEPPLMEQETWWKHWLDGGPAIRMDGDALTLTGGAVSIVFAPDASPSGPPPITGTRWELVSTTQRGDDPVPVPGNAEPPTLTIAEDGAAKIFTGCNRAQATVDVRDDGFLVFSGGSSTRKLCSGSAGRLEAAVLAVLDGKAAAGFDGDGRLTLAKNGNTLLFRAR